VLVSKYSRNHFSYNSLRIAPLSNCTLLQTNVKVLETFLEVILFKPFQLVRRITKAPSL